MSQRLLEHRKPGRPPRIVAQTVAEPPRLRFKAPDGIGGAFRLQVGEDRPGGVSWRDVATVPSFAPDWEDA